MIQNNNGRGNRKWLSKWWAAFNRLLDSPEFQKARSFDQNVVIRLFRHARLEGDQWVAWPRLETLAGEHEHRQRVAEALKRTNAAGITSIISKGGGRGKSTKRAVHIPAETGAQSGQNSSDKQVRRTDSKGSENCPVLSDKLSGFDPETGAPSGHQRVLTGRNGKGPDISHFASDPTEAEADAVLPVCVTEGVTHV